MTVQDKEHIMAAVVAWCAVRGLPDPRIFDHGDGKVQVRVHVNGDGFGLLLAFVPGLDELFRRLDRMLPDCCSGVMESGIDTTGMGRDS